MKKIISLALMLSFIAVGSLTVTGQTKQTKVKDSAAIAQKKADKAKAKADKKAAKEKAKADAAVTATKPVTPAAVTPAAKVSTPKAVTPAVNPAVTKTPTTPLPSPKPAAVQPVNKSADKIVGTDSKGRTIYEGSRGGHYVLSKSGNKEYIKKN